MEIIVLCIFSSALGMLFGFTIYMVGSDRGESNIKKQAIKNGHAKYVAKEDGTTEFTWI